MASRAPTVLSFVLPGVPIGLSCFWLLRVIWTPLVADEQSARRRRPPKPDESVSRRGKIYSVKKGRSSESSPKNIVRENVKPLFEVNNAIFLLGVDRGA